MVFFLESFRSCFRSRIVSFILCHSSMPDLLVTAVKRSDTNDTNSLYTAQRSTTSEKPSIPLRHCTFIKILSMAHCNPYQWAVQSSTDSKSFKILPLRPRNWNLSHRQYLTSSRLYANVSIYSQCIRSTVCCMHDNHSFWMFLMVSYHTHLIHSIQHSRP